MPLIWDHSEDGNIRISIWKTEESEIELMDLLGIDSIHSASTVHIKSQKRRLEMLAGRLLLIHQHPDYKDLPIRYDKHGKPHLYDVPYSISISHTGSYVALISDSSPTTGIDIEILSPRILPIISKFISQEEMNFLPENPSLQHYYLIWGAKETVYKIYGKKHLEFKKNLILKPFIFPGKDEMILDLRLNGLSKSYKLKYKEIDELIMVYGSESED